MGVRAPTPGIGPGFRLGIDLGGTKIEAALLSPAGTVLFRERVATPRGDYAGTLEAIGALAARAAASKTVSPSIGVAIPGAISPATGLVKNANSTWLNGRPFGRDLSQRLGQPVRVANDANCLALSEARDGAGTGCGVVFAVVAGTGLGGGIAVQGAVLIGANAIAGEWGHNPLPRPGAAERPGPPCYCGRRGCLETWLSGPALAADHARSARAALAPQDIARAAAQGDAAARASLARWLDRFGRALAGIVNVLDPDVIVIGGGLSNIDALYEDLPRMIAPHVFSDRFVTPVRKAMHGDSSGVIGAAWLWDAPLPV